MRRLTTSPLSSSRTGGDTRAQHQGSVASDTFRGGRRSGGDRHASSRSQKPTPPFCYDDSPHPPNPPAHPLTPGPPARPPADDMGKRRGDSGGQAAKDKEPRGSVCSLKDLKERDRGSSKSIKHPVLDVRGPAACPARAPPLHPAQNVCACTTRTRSSVRSFFLCISPAASCHFHLSGPIRVSVVFSPTQAVTELIDELDVVHVNIAEQALEHVHSNEARPQSLHLPALLLLLPDALQEQPG